MPACNQPWRKPKIRSSLFLVFLILLIQGFLAPAQAVISPTQTELLKGPFYWREKKAVAVAMLENKKIPVSVTRDGDRWLFKGAGFVEAPKDFTFTEIQKYEKLKELKDHFENVVWVPETKTLSMDVHFLSRVKHMKLHIEVDPQLAAQAVTDPSENLLFQVEEGWFQGLEGVLMVREQKHGEILGSEVGIQASSNEDLKWVPNFVFSLSAEAVMHHVAQALRAVTEKDYKASQGNSK